ncbi:sulfotransferase family protein [Roseateles sp.]|jgi:hypothetical protein|uniref:sulfotransferase family protein n=1 Tax=Roseateles sp. TaxID=1971397 RepID=UPI0037CBC3D8
MSLALTPGLLSWLRADPVWQQQALGWRLAQRWRSSWSGLNLRLSEAGLPADAPGLQDPVLILGPWRSGTTVLHELLTAATGLATPLTWHCMNAPAFRLSRSAPTDAPIARPMDGLSISACSPQEDEFAMLAMGLDSAYRAFLMPHRLDELLPTLNPQHWLDDSSWLEPWENFLHGVLLAPGSKPAQPLILKSPNHTFRLPALHRRFPGLRIVWMLRDPQEILESNRKMWRAMFAAHGISHEPDGALDRFLAEALSRSAEMLRWCMAGLPAAQWTTCRQDALRDHAAPELSRVCKELGLVASVSTAEFASSIQQTAAGRIDRYACKDQAAPLQQALAELAAAQAEAQSLVSARHS